MSSIEDKILDGPTVHYCEAGDDDIRRDSDGDGQKKQSNKGDVTSLFVRPDEETERLERLSNVRWASTSTNTGPKGVIEDYKRQTYEKYKNTAEKDLDKEFQDLLSDDSILKEYVAKRLEQEKNALLPTFGKVYHLQTGSELLDALDKEKPSVLVIVHIYKKFSKSCASVNRCIDELSSDLKHVKFATLDASVAGLSSNFKENGVPALLAYRNGNLIKSLVQLEDLLDRDFDANTIKELLVDNGVI